MLVDLEKSLGIRGVKRGTERHSLADIERFEFGDKYIIRRYIGRSVEVKQLDTILSCLRDEFREAECWDFLLRKKPIDNAFHVFPRKVMGRAWNRDTGKLCRTIESFVTLYNLTGQWPENPELQ